MDDGAGGGNNEMPTHSAIIATLQADIRYARQDIAELREERRTDTNELKVVIGDLAKTITTDRIEAARSQGAQKVVNGVLGFVAGAVAAVGVAAVKSIKW